MYSEKVITVIKTVSYEAQIYEELRNLRESKCNQSTTNYDEIKNVPQVSEVGSLVENETQIHHLGRKD